MSETPRANLRARYKSLPRSDSNSDLKAPRPRFSGFRTITFLARILIWER